MPKAELAAAGFDVKQMEQDGIFKEMELGKEPQKLYPLKSKLNEQIQMDGLYAIKAVKNEYNESVSSCKARLRFRNSSKTPRSASS